MLKPQQRNNKSQEGRQSTDTNFIENESATTEDQVNRKCDAEISVDLTQNSFDTSNHAKQNITIEITSFNNQNTTAEDTNIDDVASPHIDKEKLIRLKIKMPKSPLDSQTTKKDKSYFTEKDFSTLPKEFIKFANSMISGDDIIKGQSFKSNVEVKKRYNDKFLNEERSKSSNRFLTYKKSIGSDIKTTTLPSMDCDKPEEPFQQEEEDMGNPPFVTSPKTYDKNLADAVSPILQEDYLPTSTPKEDDIVSAYVTRAKVEPLYFTKPIPEEADEMQKEITQIDNLGKVGLNNENYVSISGHEHGHDIVDDVQTSRKENTKDLVDTGLNDQILGKLRPYSKYKLQYLNNLHKLKNIPDDSLNIEIDRAVEATEFFNKVDESQLKTVVEKSSKYKPIMGKLALLGRFSKHHVDDSKIVNELVTEKFTPFFEKRQLSLKKNHNKKVVNTVAQNTQFDTKDEDCAGGRKDVYQAVPRIVVNEDVYSIVDKTSKSKDEGLTTPIDQDAVNIARSISEEQNRQPPNTDYNFEEFKLYQEVNFRGTTSDLWSGSKTNELSSYSDFDTEKFLQTAIGDVSLDSQTMVPKVHNHTRRNSDDHSIQTAEMSLLISKASSISTFCSAVWRRVTRKNSPKKTQDLDRLADDSKLVEEQKNKRVTLLQQEAAVQTEVIRQASKALDYCDNPTDADLVTHIVEAERVILIATHKSNIIRNEIEEIEHYSKIKSACSHLGTVVFKDLQFKMQEPSGKYDDSTQWFVCILNRGTEVIASRPIQAKEDGSVLFKEDFTFDYLAPDFEINVSLFTLKVKKHKDTKRSTFQRMKFFSFRRDPKPSNQTLTSRFSRTSLRSPVKDTVKDAVIRKTSFLLLGSTTLTIRDTSKTILPLTVVNFANIKESFCATITTKVLIEDRYASFLNVGTESCRQVYYNRRWCVMDGTDFKYWTSPDDEDLQGPLRVIDLSCCVRNVAPVDRSLCPRARTLLLECLVLPIGGSSDESSHSTSKYFLTCDTSEELHNWEVALNSVINTLRGWNRLKTICT